jgi:membrane protein implicated in regulation of membrane protease activity
MDLSNMQYFEMLFWHWWALGLVLVVMEALTPSGVFAGMAVSAGATGAITLSNEELAWEPQLAIFAVITVIITFAWRKILGVSASEEAEFSTRSKAKALVGTEFELALPLQNGFGEALVDDVNWELKGPDTKKGNRVRVIGIDGSILVVYPLPQKSQEIAKEAV